MSSPLPPSESPGLLLWRVTLAWQRRVAEALRPLALTQVQFVVLSSAWWLGGVGGERPSQRRVAEFAGIDPMMTSQVVRGLEERRLIRRSADAADARVRLLAVPAAGRRLAARAVAVVESVDAEFFAAAGTERLLAALSRLDGARAP